MKTYFENDEPVVVLVAEPKNIEKVVEILNSKRRVIKSYPFLRATSFNKAQIEDLRMFLREPNGILVTDAEAFNGMQARNIVLLCGTSQIVRIS